MHMLGVWREESITSFFSFLSSFFPGDHDNEKRRLKVSLEALRFRYFENLRTRYSAVGG